MHETIKRDIKVNTILTAIALVILTIYYESTKLLYTFKDCSGIDTTVELCNNVVPLEWQFWIGTFILYLLVSEWLFYLVRLNEWQFEGSSVSKSKMSAFFWGAFITAMLSVFSGVIVNQFTEVMKALGLIVLILIGLGIAVGIIYYLVEGIQWLFKKLVKWNEKLLKKFGGK